MKKIFIFSITVLIAVSLLVSNRAFLLKANAASGLAYVEEFITKTYRDEGATTALWNIVNGSVTLPHETRGQVNPDVEFIPGDGIAVSWNGYGDGSGVFAQRFNYDGARFWDNDIKVTVKPTTSRIIQSKIAPNPTLGETWLDVLWKGIDDFKLTHQTISETGERLFDKFGFDDGQKLMSSGGADYIALARDGTGSNSAPTYVAWADGTRNGVYLQKLDSGVDFPEFKWAEDVRVSASSDSQDDRSPDIAVDSDGDVYVVWSSPAPGAPYDSNNDQVLMQKFSSAGVPTWLNPIVVGEGTVPSIDVDLSSAHPRIVVSWQKWTSQGYNVLVSIFGIGGDVSSDVVAYRVATIPTSFTTNPPAPIVLANHDPDASGMLWRTVWYDSVANKILSVFAAFDVVSGEVRQVAPFEIPLSGSKTTGSARTTFDVVFGTDELSEFGFSARYYVVWSDVAEDFGDSDIFGAKFDSMGNLLWKKQLNQVDPATQLSGTVQSLKVNGTSSPIQVATLTASDNSRVGGPTIDYYVSNDGGLTWISALNGQEVVFSSSGNDLRWKAILSTSDAVSVPVLDSLRIEYRDDGGAVTEKGCLPDGTLIKLPDDFKIYVIENCNRRWLRSAEEFSAGKFAWENVQIVDISVVDAYAEIARQIFERNLFRMSDGPDVYIVRNGELHKIPDASTFTAKRLLWDQVEVVDPSYLEDMPRGYELMPEGALLRAAGTSDVWIVRYANDKQFKRLILNPSVFNSYGHLRWEDVREVRQALVDVFPTSDLVRVAGTDTVYRLAANGDNGTRQRISATKLVAMGFDAESIYEINVADYDSYVESIAIE